MIQEISTTAWQAEARTEETKRFIRDTKRIARRKFTPEEKIRIVLEGFRRDTPIRHLCRRESVRPSTYQEEVWHAFATKCHPVRGIMVFDNDIIISLVPFYSPEDRMQGKGAKAVFDCRFPASWPPSTTPRRITFDKAYPSDDEK